MAVEPLNNAIFRDYQCPKVSTQQDWSDATSEILLCLYFHSVQICHPGQPHTVNLSGEVVFAWCLFSIIFQEWAGLATAQSLAVASLSSPSSESGLNIPIVLPRLWCSCTGLIPEFLLAVKDWMSVKAQMGRKWTVTLASKYFEPTAESEVWEKRIWIKHWKRQHQEDDPREADSASLALTSVSTGH